MGDSGISTIELQQRPVVLADDLTGQRKWADPGRIAVFSVGALLLALFVAGVVIAQTNGSKVDKTTPRTVTVGHSETSTTEPTGKPKVATMKTTSSTSGGATAETTKSAPSEGLLLAVLGTGVVLVLVGALYSRITTIKLPGGAEIALSPEESKQVADHVAEKASPDASQPDVAQATAAALQIAQTRKLADNKPLDQGAIAQVATAALEATGVPQEADK